MNIANQGFPATRADLNNALQAIATNNSGTSAPSTTFANQWFYNTNTNKLFIRNEANNAFIEVATLDQTNNEWQITTGVIQAKDGDGLALKTDDGTTRLFIKDSDGRVGIATESPSTQFQSKGGSVSTPTDNDELITNSSASFVVNHSNEYGLYTGYANSANDAIGVAATRSGGGALPLSLQPFGGNVGISETSPSSKIHAKNSSVGESWSAYAGTVATLEDNSGNGAILQFVSNNAHTGEIWFGDAAARNQGRMRYEHSSNRLELWSNAVEAAGITSDQVFQMKQFGMGDSIGGDTAMLMRNKVSSSSPINFDFICDTAGSWTPLGFYVFVSSIHSAAQRPRSAYFYIRGAVLDSGSLGSIGVADSGGDTSDVSVAVSDQGGTDPITARVSVTHPNNRVNVTVHALNYMGIQRCD